MKISYRMLGGHLIAVILGMVLAITLGGRSRASSGKPGAAEPGKPQTTAAGATRVSRPVGKKPTPAPSTYSAATCRQAWQILQQQSAADRRRMRPVLLARWADVDLAGAMEAALLEPDAAQLLDAFHEAFIKDPLAFKSMCVGDPYGLKTAGLRDWWIPKMAADNPEELLTMAGEFGAVDRAKIVKTCLNGIAHDPERVWSMIGGLAGLPDTEGNRKLWAAAGAAVAERLSAEMVVAKLSAIQGPAGDAMISDAMAVMLNRTDYAGARATYDALPPDLKPRIVKAALAKPGTNVSAYLAALDEVVNTSEWAKLQKPIGAQLHNMKPDASQYPAMLDWAAKLPEREDTMDLYRVAVRKFVTYQPQQAREWIANLPGGWKQQNSLAAYVQCSLYGRGDLEGAKWALPQISDPRFRTEAEGFLKSYEERALKR